MLHHMKTNTAALMVHKYLSDQRCKVSVPKYNAILTVVAQQIQLTNSTAVLAQFCPHSFNLLQCIMGVMRSFANQCNCLGRLAIKQRMLKISCSGSYYKYASSV